MTSHDAEAVEHGREQVRAAREVHRRFLELDGNELEVVAWAAIEAVLDTPPETGD